jgi:hypothetical protein
LKENDAAVMYAHLMASVPSVHELRPELPEAVDTAIERAMAKDPGERYPSAGAFAAEARRALGVSGQAPGTVPAPLSAGRRRRRVGLVTAALLMVILLVVAAIVFRPRGTDHPSAGHSSGGPPPAAAGQLVEIDPVTSKVVDKFDVGGSAAAVAVGNGAVWVVDPQDKSVVRIDASSGRAVARIPVGQNPNAITVGEGGVWVCTSDGIVQRIDPTTNSVAATVRVKPDAQVIAAGDGAVLVANLDFTERIDPVTSGVTTVRGRGAGLGLTAGDGKLWMVSYALGGNSFNTTIKPQLYQFDSARNRGSYVGTFIETNGGGSVTLPLAVGGGEAWEPVVGTDNQIISMNTISGQPGTIIRVGAYPVGLALDGIGGLWVLNQGDGTVWKISTESHQSFAVVPVGQRAMGIAADADGVWVTLQSASGS